MELNDKSAGMGASLASTKMSDSMFQSIERLGRLPISAVIIGTVVAILIGLMVWIAPSIRTMSQEDPAAAPFAKTFLTNRKCAMLGALERILSMYRIHAQVAISAILEPVVRPLGRSRLSDPKELGHRIVDFVIVDPNSSSIVALLKEMLA